MQAGISTTGRGIGSGSGVKASGTGPGEARGSGPPRDGAARSGAASELAEAASRPPAAAAAAAAGEATAACEAADGTDGGEEQAADMRGQEKRGPRCRPGITGAVDTQGLEVLLACRPSASLCGPEGGLEGLHRQICPYIFFCLEGAWRGCTRLVGMLACRGAP